MRITKIMAVLLIGVLLILGACGPAPSLTQTQPAPATPGTEPAAFTTSALTITPNTVKPGESVMVGVMVTNTGGQQGTYTVVMKLHDGTIVKTQDVTLAGGAKQNVTLNMSMNSAGTHMIMIDKLTGSLVVQDAAAPMPTQPAPTQLAPTPTQPAPTQPAPTPTQPAPTQPAPTPGTGPAAFTTSDLIITPDMQEPGGKVQVSVKVTNTGGQAGVYPVVLKVQNNTTKTEDVQTQTVTLAGGASQTVTFTVSAGVNGSYTIMIDKLTGNLMVDEHAMM